VTVDRGACDEGLRAPVGTNYGGEMKYSIAQQRQAVEHLLALFMQADSTITGAARQAVLTLAWLERRAELIKALDRLERERPDLVDLFKEFPGAEIADVRAMYPMFNNGSGHD
jgi:hypothetical protein